MLDSVDELVKISGKSVVNTAIAVAFDSTFVSLILSIIAMFWQQTAASREEETIQTEADQIIRQIVTAANAEVPNTPLPNPIPLPNFLPNLLPNLLPEKVVEPTTTTNPPATDPHRQPKKHKRALPPRLTLALIGVAILLILSVTYALMHPELFPH
jgi:hypothetical protein